MCVCSGGVYAWVHLVSARPLSSVCRGPWSEGGRGGSVDVQGFILAMFTKWSSLEPLVVGHGMNDVVPGDQMSISMSDSGDSVR